MKTKFWIIIIIVGSVVTAILMTIFILKPLAEEIEDGKAIERGLTQDVKNLKSALGEVEAEKIQAEKNFSRCTEINQAYEAELDTIRPKLAIADSLITVNAELKAQLAFAQAAGKKPAGKTATTGTVKASKGKPVIDDASKTFTYLASDSTLVSTLAPSGYALIKKPR